MPRRAPPQSGYYEEDYFEAERERYPRSRRPERSSFEDDVGYRRRESMPLGQDIERMRVRERPPPPREFVRETFIVPPRDLGPPVRMRRSADDIGPIPDREEEYMRTRPRRSHRPPDIDPDELINERDMRRSERHRPRDLDEEYAYDERERRARRPRPEREFEEEEIAIRRRASKPPSPLYDSEIDPRPRERRYSDVRDEVYVRSSESRRKPHFREVQVEADIIDEREERPRRSRHRDGSSPTLSKEEEMVMQWKDRPSPRELEEDEEIRVRDTRRRIHRSPPRARYGRGPPGSWPDSRDDEDVDVENDLRSSRHPKSRRQAEDDFELDARSRMRSRPDRRELEHDEDIDIHSFRRPNPRWEQTDDDELDIRSSRRPRREREQIDDDELGPRPQILSRHGRGNIELDEEIDIRSPRRSRPGHGGIEVDEVIDIRRDELDREPRRKITESEEIIIRKDRRGSTSRKRSPSPEPIRAPPIHQDVITHHRHIDHGFEDVRPPRAPSPEKASTQTSFDEIDIRHQTRRRGRQSEEDISFKHKYRDEEESVSPTSGRSADFRNPWKRDERRSRPKPRSLSPEDESLVAEKSYSRSRRGVSRDLDEIEVKMSEKMQASSLADDIPRTSIDEWSVVHAPTKEETVMTGGLLDIVEVAPKDASLVDSESEEEVEVEQHSRAAPKVHKERRDERWTEITKDLVVRDAIEQLGYEFEETKMFYYIFSYLEPADIDELVELSDHIRRTRRRRIKEMHRERVSIPARSASLIDRMPHRVRTGGGRHIREREWIIDGHR
ncbi:hypothetical protein N7494_011083 [Penicillium frequentans]|uniref:DUF8035 domain-containing protein n=1 Tax=Penicillium frequentans TaxID=3151616 RepID=A0AAD6G9B8_9EURO|nr:hypothetical protein N7494_011083 [Penicillium glabrum]